MIRGVFEAIVRNRWVVIVGVLAISVAAALAAGRVTFDASVDIWFLEDDPELVTYRAFLETFQTDEVVVVAAFADDVFDPKILGAIDRITRAAAELPSVHRVRSLTNARRFASISDNGEPNLELVPVVPSLTSTSTEMRRIALADPTLSGLIVAPDGRATAVVVELAHDANTFEAKVALVVALRDLATQEALRDGLELHVAGTPAVNEAVFRYSQRDFRTVGASALLLILLISLFMFRSLVSALLPMIVVVVAALWTLGVMGALGMNLTVVSQSLLTVIFAVGVADSIHVIADHRHQALRDESLAHTMTGLLVPCVFTTITTAAGMLSLLISHLAPIRDFGWLAALGVTFALILSLTLLPALLTFVPPPTQVAPHPSRLKVLLDRLAHLPERSRAPILVVFALIVVGSAVLASQVRVGANPMAYFRDDDPVRLETLAVDTALGGSTSIELLVRAPNAGLQDPAILARIEAFERWLETLPAVTRVVSVTDALRALDRALTGEGVIPSSREKIAQAYLLMEDEEDFDSMVSLDYETARISARVRMSDAAALAERIPEVDAKIARDFPGPELSVRPTGFVKLISEMELYIVQSQVESFAAAFVVISLLMMLLLRSVRLGLFAMIPNVAPVIAGLGFMKLAGIQLDTGTAMVGSITLGLVVDDTVHFMTRLSRLLREGLPLERAIERTMEHAGRAIVITSLVLAAGFGVLALGSFTPNVYLGLVAAVVILLALVADLVVLPAALLTLRRRIE